MKSATVSVGLLLAVVACSNYAWAISAPPEGWAWFRSEYIGKTTVGEWDMDRGSASIQRDGDVVKGQLVDENGKYVTMHFTGTIHGGDVTLRVIFDGTDADPFVFRGQLHRACYDHHRGEEHVVLTSGSTVIGLSRQLWQVPKCEALPER